MLEPSLIEAARELERFGEPETWSGVERAKRAMADDEDYIVDRHYLCLGLLDDLDKLWTKLGRWGHRGPLSEDDFHKAASSPELAAAMFFGYPLDTDVQRERARRMWAEWLAIHVARIWGAKARGMEPADASAGP